MYGPWFKQSQLTILHNMDNCRVTKAGLCSRAWGNKEPVTAGEIQALSVLVNYSSQKIHVTSISPVQIGASEADSHSLQLLLISAFC